MSFLIDDRNDRLSACWRIQDCGKCLKSKNGCGWCPAVRCILLVETRQRSSSFIKSAIAPNAIALSFSQVDTLFSNLFSCLFMSLHVFLSISLILKAKSLGQHSRHIFLVQSNSPVTCTLGSSIVNSHQHVSLHPPFWSLSEEMSAPSLLSAMSCVPALWDAAALQQLFSQSL